MNSILFLKALVIGLSIAAPVGPIGVLCIRRSLKDGFWAGLVAGMGAATADAAYACVAAFGLTAISEFLVRLHSWLGLIGGVFLCTLGVRTFLSRPAAQAAPGREGRFLSLYGSTFLLTIANPATIVSFAIVFAALGLGSSHTYLAATSMVSGVFFGSALWWVILSGGVGLVRSRVTPAGMRPQTESRARCCSLSGSMRSSGFDPERVVLA